MQHTRGAGARMGRRIADVQGLFDGERAGQHQVLFLLRALAGTPHEEANLCVRFKAITLGAKAEIMFASGIFLFATRTYREPTISGIPRLEPSRSGLVELANRLQRL